MVARLCRDSSVRSRTSFDLENGLAIADHERPHFERLIQFVPPPSDPRPIPGHPRVINREKIEQGLGIGLPDFIWDFGATYGNGEFESADGQRSTSLEIFNPHDPSYSERFRECAETFAYVNEGYELPFECYPAPGGLLPIGYPSNGMTLYAQATGAGIYDFVLDERTARHDPYSYPRFSGMCFYEFLLRFLQNDLFDDEWKQSPAWGFGSKVVFKRY